LGIIYLIVTSVILKIKEINIKTIRLGANGLKLSGIYKDDSLVKILDQKKTI